MLSVIIVSFNTREITLKCLDCVYRSEGTGEFEVIVVDNASTDGSVEAVAKNFPKVKLIKNSDNAGFAIGNNQGMKAATGETMLLLNSDCFVMWDTLAKASAAMTRTKADILGCQLLNPDGTWQPSWGYFPTLRRIGQMMVFVDNLPIIRDGIDSIHVRSEMRGTVEQSVDWVTGAFMMLTRDVFAKTGGLDEKYFMYGEEMEWQYRAVKLGCKIWYAPAAQAVHMLGASSSDRGPAVVGEMKGWMKWFGKHNPAWQRKILPFVIILGCGLRIPLKPAWSEHYKKAIREMRVVAGLG